MSESLWTHWSASFGLRVPIVNAPMGGVAGGALATAVTGAGGLGMVGIGSAGTVGDLRRETAIPRRRGVRFGIGLIAWAVTGDPELLAAAVDAGPALISVSFADDWSWVERVHDAGIAAATQVYDTETAVRAYEAGVDVLVARGGEGGGHGVHRTGTLVLLQEVLDAVPAPVLAAGGIASHRGLAAVLAAGAAGAWLGTPFVACPESSATDAVRSLMVRADGADTVCTRVFDVTLGYPWPARYDERVLRNDVTDRWRGAEGELAADAEARTSLARAITRGDPTVTVVDAGQGVGLVTEVRPAAAIIEELVRGASALLAGWAQRSGPATQADR
ncbi:MAG TPA: nitronate monooxygenase [Acidimicrobiales bacterium]|nr:nitronate monooxygenase [Acidimicrobiales bacterium]